MKVKIERSTLSLAQLEVNNIFRETTEEDGVLGKQPSIP